MSLLKNIRFYLLSFSFLLSVAIYYWVDSNIAGDSLKEIRLVQIYALTAVSYLYVTLMIGPVVYLLKFLPARGQIFKARRATGISTFYFGLLHAYLAFFNLLGGFEGLGFLEDKYLLAIILSSGALFIFTLMAFTSFDFMVRKLGFARWKFLHRFIYLASILVLIHALLLGTHFQDLSENIPQIFLGALSILILLEANRFDAFLRRKFVTMPPLGPTLVLSAVLITIAIFYTHKPFDSSTASVGIHSQHLQIAQQMQNQGSNLSNIPGLTGDRTKRFNVEFNKPSLISPKSSTPLKFQVFDASSGNAVQFFDVIFEKTVHMIVVDSKLEYFDHVHPTQNASGFNIDYNFPTAGVYHIYLDFQPKGAIEQQFAFVVNVGNSTTTTSSAQISESVRTFDKYTVELLSPNPLLANQLSVGGQKLTFNIKNATDGQGVTNLKPYLSSFGHLVMINRDTYEYLHVHPTNTTAPKPEDLGGPDVEFMPLGLYGPVKPGIYRVFAQFNPDGKLFTADFTVEVK